MPSAEGRPNGARWRVRLLVVTPRGELRVGGDDRPGLIRGDPAQRLPAAGAQPEEVRGEAQVEVLWEPAPANRCDTREFAHDRPMRAMSAP